MSQELPNISKIPQLNKAAFTNILDVFREREIRVKMLSVVKTFGARYDVMFNASKIMALFDFFKSDYSSLSYKAI